VLSPVLDENDSPPSTVSLRRRFFILVVIESSLPFAWLIQVVLDQESRNISEFPVAMSDFLRRSPPPFFVFCIL